MKQVSGFTLIELMISVAIVGILAGIAIPSYQSHVLKSRRAVAKGDLLGLANALERHFTETNSYCDAGGAGGANSCGGAVNDTGAPEGISFATQSPVDGNAPHHDLNISALTPTTFTIQAIPIAGGPQANDPCGTLELDHTGAKLVTGTAPVEQCW